MTERDAEDLAARLSDRTPAGIAEQIGQLIAEKVLPADSRLPTVRDLAQEVGVSVGTIAQAWSLLREQGLVETRRRGGTRVLPHARRRAEDFAGPGSPLKRLGFSTIGLFDSSDPAAGYESTLRIIELGEQCGFDSAWLGHRHLQDGISSPVALLAAASQRTSRIELGIAATPLGWENPLRLAEDLATVDVLCGGRLNPGFSIGRPKDYDTVRDALYPDTAESEDFSCSRAERLASFIAGEPVRESGGKRQAAGELPGRVQPHSPGLRQRLWCSADSLDSAQWAGQTGLNLLSCSVLFPDDDAGDSPDSAEWQAQQIRAFRAAHPDGDLARAAQRLVVIPTDSATREQEAKYRAWVDERMMSAPVFIGSSDEIADTLLVHAGYLEVEEVVFAQPFGFTEEDYGQILADTAARLGPALGWKPQTDR